jgi:hypothetical protein
VATNLAETGRSIAMTPEREVAETRVAQTVQGGGAEMQPAEVAASVLDAVQSERFLILPDPTSETVMRNRAADLNAFLEARLAALLV